jgi:hypothetical protein
LRPAVGYSEDIDLVQMTAGPIGETLDALRGVLDPWLGAPRRATKEGRVNLVYRFQSEDEPAKPMRLKIEITQRYLNITDVGVVRSTRELWGRRRAAGRAQG